MGPFFVLLSAACFAAMAIFGKFAYAEGATSGTLLLLRFGLAAAVLWLIVAARQRPASGPGSAAAPRTVPRLDRRTMVTAFALGVFGYAMQAGFFFAALERLDASVLGIVLYTFPVFVTIGAVLLGRDRLTAARVAALVAASAGITLVLAGQGGLEFPVVGTLLGFSAALTYTVYILVADSVLGRVEPLLLSAIVMTGATVTTGLRLALTGGIDFAFPPITWIWIAGIVLVSTVGAMVLFFMGLQRTGPTNAAILSTFEPVVTAGLAAALLGEQLTPVQLAGAGLVLAAAVVLQIRRRPAPVVPGVAIVPEVMDSAHEPVATHR